MIRRLSSRATIAAGTRPPRVMQTTAWNGPTSASRHASARASRWKASQETGKAFSSCGCGMENLSAPGAKQGSERLSHLGEHGLDRGLGGGEPRRIARAHHDIGVGPALVVEERVAADHGPGMRLRDVRERAADIA